MTWELELIGNIEVLCSLAEMAAPGEFAVCKKEHGYVLIAERFRDLHEAKDVLEEGQRMVESLRGATELYVGSAMGSATRLTAGTVYRRGPDGSVGVFPLAGSARLTLRGQRPTVKVGGPVLNPADLVVPAVLSAIDDEAVAKALRLRGAGPCDWTELYRVYEVVFDDVGSVIWHHNWASKKKIDLFRQTANSVHALGDHARHGKDTSKPPPRPMTLAEARHLIDVVLRSWLQSKPHATSLAPT